MGAITNFLENVDTLLVKKTPYQIYIFASLICLMFVGAAVYEYTHPSQEVQDLIGLKQLREELFNGGYNMEQVYQGPVRPTDDEVYFRETGITKPLEVKN